MRVSAIVSLFDSSRGEWIGAYAMRGRDRALALVASLGPVPAGVVPGRSAPPVPGPAAMAAVPAPAPDAPASAPYGAPAPYGPASAPYGPADSIAYPPPTGRASAPAVVPAAPAVAPVLHQVGVAVASPSPASATLAPLSAYVGAPPTWSANWYPDPTERYEFRWYDGERWTGAVGHYGNKFLDPKGAEPS